MEEILTHIQEILGVPEHLINSCTFLPEYIKEALVVSIKFIPWLYFLYYIIELVERFFMKNIHIFVALVKRFGAIFGAGISVIPECGYQVVASTFYSRKMITRGTLLAFFISCSDDALPLLFMDFSKAAVIIPIIVIKIIAGILVAYLVDLVFIFNSKKTEKVNSINTDLNEPGCCYHKITTDQNPPFWWKHPLVHTFNMFMFTFFSLAVINCAINGFGGVENLAQFLMIDSPYQVIAGAVIGMVPNCVVSVFLVVAYLKGVVSFPTLIAGLVTVTGLGLTTLVKRNSDNKDNNLISAILLISGILVGLFVFFNMQIVSMIQSFMK